MGDCEQDSKPVDVSSSEDPSLRVPLAVEGQQVDIHRPKPWHGFREFLKEYGIIVLGVLTALAGEQAVEAIHWRGEVIEAREALKVELDHALGALNFTIAQSPCVFARLDEVDAWIAANRAGKPMRLVRPFPTMESYSYGTNVWDLTKAGQTAAHMPLQIKIDYATIYSGLATTAKTSDEERAAIRELKDFDLTAIPEPASLPHLAGTVRSIRTAEGLWPLQLALLAPVAKRLGLSADTLPHYHPAAERKVCESLLPLAAPAPLPR